MRTDRIASLVAALCLGLLLGLTLGGDFYGVAALFSASGAALMVATCVIAGRL